MQGKVPAIPDQFYADWRCRVRSAGLLHETDPAAPPPEQLLQAIWFHQRLHRDRLLTTDGRKVTVLHPGFWNRESGPDFRDALIQLERDPPRIGDVEVDLAPANWRGHGHDRNPAFQNVLLHVVWQPTGPTGLPTLPLRERLDAPLAELADELGRENAQQLPLELAGQCCAPLKQLDAAALRELLHQAALERLRNKAAAFASRARQTGWDQALWEGLFRALGYKHNTWPMQRLAEVIGDFQDIGERPLNAQAWQARLLGLAGLLPHDVTGFKSKPGDRRYSEARHLWDLWWRERETFSEVMLPRSLWRFGGLRPANHPQRRLALAAHWLAANDLPGRIEKWFTTDPPDRVNAIGLLKVLQPPPDLFWANHWTLTSAAMARPQPLLGSTRATDLAINVILPWLWARANAGGNTELRSLAVQRFLDWPAAGDNSVLKLARQRLLGGRPLPRPLTAALQQGLLQVVRDFCEHSNARCDHCTFPELVRELENHE